MEYETAREIIDCLPSDRTLYHYFKDYYAVCLLRRELESLGIRRIAQLKQSRFASLTTKPVIREILAGQGNGEIPVEGFEPVWPEMYETYVLTLGVWGGPQRHFAAQTSRPGVNLVLQLNFSERHDQMFRRCIGKERDMFNYTCHPISALKTTLAWARIDLDFSSNEALIEEIQNDWLRDSDQLLRFYQLAAARKQRSFYYFGRTIEIDRAYSYFHDEINRHRKIWSEAMLNAALGFLLDEIGIGTIYYHSHVTGAAVKGIYYSKPPRSLYSKLPGQFCFEKANTAPEFLINDKHSRRRLRKIKKQLWYRMEN